MRVVDGDTVVLDGGEKLRLIGVDTPETVDPRKPVERFGHEASAFTTRRLQGKQVQLAYDWQRTDKYRRTLAYICLPDGELVNETIIREGFGVAYTKYPFTAALMERFRAAERQAREAGRGLWAPPAGEPMAHTTKESRVRRTVAGILGAAILLGATGLAAAGGLAPWMTDPRFGARRDAFGPGVHMDATGGVYRDSVPAAWQFPPFRHDAYGPGIGSDGTGRLVLPERGDGTGDD